MSGADLVMDGVGLAGGVLTSTMSVPQAVRLLRRRDPAGVSAASFGGFAGVGVSWVVYGVVEHRWAVIVANAAMVVTALAVLAGLVLCRSPVRSALATCGGCIVVSVAVLGVLGGVAAGWWAAALTGLIRIPQLVASGSARVSGVSSNTWLMVTAGNVLWLSYGWYFGATPVAVGSGLAIVLGTSILVRTARHRGPSDPETLVGTAGER